MLSLSLATATQSLLSKPTTPVHGSSIATSPSTSPKGLACRCWSASPMRTWCGRRGIVRHRRKRKGCVRIGRRGMVTRRIGRYLRPIVRTRIRSFVFRRIRGFELNWIELVGKGEFGWFNGLMCCSCGSDSTWPTDRLTGLCYMSMPGMTGQTVPPRDFPYLFMILRNASRVAAVMSNTYTLLCYLWTLVYIGGILLNLWSHFEGSFPTRSCDRYMCILYLWIV